MIGKATAGRTPPGRRKAPVRAGAAGRPIDRARGHAYLRKQMSPAGDPGRSFEKLMSLRHIICIPDNRLRQISKPIERVDDDVLRLMDDMLETMYDAPGIGLAAIQLAIPKRVVVIDTSKPDEQNKPICFINPEIVWASEEKNVYEEGCLSIPEFYADVEQIGRASCRERVYRLV
jgi:hypothetical protein